MPMTPWLATEPSIALASGSRRPRATGERPRIAAYLDSTDPAEHDALFAELLALEVELRREDGESPGIEEYVAEFPDREAVVAKIFSELEPSRALPDRTRDNGFPATACQATENLRGPRRFPIHSPAFRRRSASSRRSATTS